ncbi:MAG: HAMP domain-containing protein [Candidatus Omnitrophica bacterium]|nr:HAMP domain-containing protein [Candidatus Omnitrophota bacterium]MBU4478189.1 HAMP domain-containing protein [Candidatus Omnitrophota bacterium]MCG2703815.1 methyl-accepting chemotaxis protein [Candidatus Omnitrophota bacterium]
MFRGLRSKLTMVIIAVAVVPLLISYLFILDQIQKTLRHNQERQVAQVLGHLNANFKDFERKSLTFVNLLKNIPDIQDAVTYTLQTKDTKQLLEVLKAFSSEDYDTLQVFDSKGTVLIRADMPELFGDSKADKPLVQAALRGKVVIGVEAGERGYAVRAFAPLRSAGEIVGLVQVGKFLNADFAKELSQSSASRIAFFVNRGLTGYYLWKEHVTEAAKEKTLSRLEQLIRSKSTDEIILDNEPFSFSTFSCLLGEDSTSIDIAVGVSNKESILAQNRIKTILFILLIICIIIAAIISYVFAQSLTKPLISLARQVGDWKGDLSRQVEVDSKDETLQVAKAFNKLMDTLRKIVEKVQQTADKVKRSAEALSASTEQMNSTTVDFSSTIQEINKGVSIQAQRLEDTSRVMSDIGALSSEIASSTNETAQAAKKSFEQAQLGKEAATETVKIMERISDIVSQAVETVTVLGDRSQEIGEIIETITSIADQTNLLALNAAIEAARAGESGRGFAVVAEEVKKLAEGSARAASKIANLIAGIQSETRKVVSSIESGYREVNEGKKVVSKASTALNEIVSVSDRTTKMVMSMNDIIKKQLERIATVVNSVNEVASIAEKSSTGTQQVSVSVEEMCASMEEMSSSAQVLFQYAVELNKLVEQLGK